MFSGRCGSRVRWNAPLFLRDWNVELFPMRGSCEISRGWFYEGSFRFDQANRVV